MSRLLSKLGSTGRRSQDDDYVDDDYHDSTVRAPSRTGRDWQNPIGGYQPEPGSGIIGGSAVHNPAPANAGGLPHSHGPGNTTGFGSSSTTGYGRPGGVNVSTTTTTNTTTSHGVTTSGLADRTRANDNYSSPTTTGGHNSGVGHNITNVADSSHPDHAGLNNSTASGNNPFFGASNSSRRASQAGVGGTGIGSGPHSHLENRDAVPTAGGNKIGTGAAYDSPSQGVPHQHQQHQYGRDGTLGGTAGYASTHDGHYNNPNSTNTAGPHDSDAMNKLDPRVDSDQSKLGNQYGNNDRFGNNNRYNDNAYDSTTHDGHYDNPQSTNAGPHKSNLLNKLDPRVDSDESKLEKQHNRHMSRTASRNQFGDETQTPLSQSDAFNRRHNTGSFSQHSNPGPAPNTAGPHKSDMMNKMDPRVDSDQDYPYGRDAGTGNPLNSTSDKHILAGAEKYSQTRNGLKRATKWGGDYEAGYRDALAHVEAEAPGWRFFQQHNS